MTNHLGFSFYSCESLWSVRRRKYVWENVPYVGVTPWFNKLPRSLEVAPPPQAEAILFTTVAVVPFSIFGCFTTLLCKHPVKELSSVCVCVEESSNLWFAGHAPYPWHAWCFTAYLEFLIGKRRAAPDSRLCSTYHGARAASRAIHGAEEASAQTKIHNKKKKICFVLSDFSIVSFSSRS